MKQNKPGDDTPRDIKPTNIVPGNIKPEDIFTGSRGDILVQLGPDIDLTPEERFERAKDLGVPKNGYV